MSLNNVFKSFADLLSPSPSFRASPSQRSRSGASFAEEIVAFSRNVGFMRNNRYCILFNGVPTAASLIPVDSRRLSISCSSVTFPEATFATADRNIAGPKQTIPFVQQFGDSSSNFSFLCGTDLYEYLVFRSWQRAIVDPVYRYPAFYDDYAKNCTLTVMLLPQYVRNYNEALERLEANEIYGVTFSEIYPKTVALQQIQTDSSNATLSVNVNFGFRELVPFRDYTEDFRYAMAALNPGQGVQTIPIPDGIKKDYNEAEIQKFKSMFLAQKPLGSNKEGITFPPVMQPQGVPKAVLPPEPQNLEASTNVVLPPQPKNIAANVFLNNLITSGINTAALFKGI